jgi:hypothetical protein
MIRQVPSLPPSLYQGAAVAGQRLHHTSLMGFQTRFHPMERRIGQPAPHDLTYSNFLEGRNFVSVLEDIFEKLSYIILQHPRRVWHKNKVKPVGIKMSLENGWELSMVRTFGRTIIDDWNRLRLQ